MTAVLFGSISTLVDTSELQREAFNRAFAAHDLDWTWERDEYRDLLATSGGRDRVAAYAEERGADVDADAVHATKTRLFQELLADEPPPLRPGVAEAIDAAREQGHPVGVVTTTSPENVAAVLAAAGLADAPLTVVLDAEAVATPKPDPAAYLTALDRLGVEADDAVAVEDNLGGLASARAAGVACVAFPNANTADHDFEGAAVVVDRVELDGLLGAADAR
ncbi:HAD-IA family hydrolase [Iamia majanohamensis]|uniref:HAD-IA family hydrolase n=1 Tax=Iamia majanohamensis TaxID=467976 RepID=A0AAE9Y5W3_9ACTN|nr:HAD-IA family hydrolase [Iamia majanohamensis]WCO66091.1 HAD-IA family hydrolase [Iamia majanohamensis]